MYAMYTNSYVHNFIQVADFFLVFATSFVPSDRLLPTVPTSPWQSSDE